MRKTRNNLKIHQENKLEYYFKLPYTFVITPEESGGFFVKIEELPGCMSQGKTMEEAIRNIEEAKRIWLKTALERKIEIPLPDSMRDYSGKFLVRLPVSLHKRIAKLAKKEGVSINQMVLSLLSEKITILEITDIVKTTIWELKTNLKESYYYNTGTMVSEASSPYEVKFPKGQWSIEENIRS